MIETAAKAAPAQTAAPYRCPDEAYDIPQAICRVRQRKGFEKCAACPNRKRAWLEERPSGFTLTPHLPVSFEEENDPLSELRRRTARAPLPRWKTVLVRVYNWF